MSTITKEATHLRLPARAGDRVDAIFGAAAVLITLFALLGHFCGIFG